MAHTYAELKYRALQLEEDLKFVVLGRLIAQVILVNEREPRINIGECQLSEENALRLADWIEKVFKAEGRTAYRGESAEG